MKRIDNKYKVIKKLGEGFGGAVFLVESNGARVALKQLHLREDHGVLSTEEILDNFKQEFTTLKNLKHPHILRILDFGYDLEEQFYYFTTEYIEGQDIFEATRESPPQEIEDLFVQVLRALSYLHSHHIYHFDIKPLNILVTNQEGQKTAKLIDFGLTAFRKKGMLAGTPAFIAPEAIVEEPMDGRSDLYSLGVTWYTCLHGKNPFEGKDTRETIMLQKIWTPPTLSNPSNEIPTYLDPILEKLLKKNPSARYHRPDQVIRDLNWAGSKHYPLETDATALAYLPGEGKLVAREEEWGQLLSYFDRVFVTHSDLKCGVIISGPRGSGKTRLLKELKYHAQLHTIPVVEEREVFQSTLKQDCVLLIDDVDSALLDLIERWLMLFHQHSVLVVLTGISPDTTSGSWYNIFLKDFDRPKVKQYMAEVLGVSAPPESLVEELYTRSEGNPLLLTEILQALIQSQQLFDEHGRWSVSQLEDIGVDFGKLSIPKTLAEYTQSKFDRLPFESQKILLLVALARGPLTRDELTHRGWGRNLNDWKVLEEERLVLIDPSGTVRLMNPSFRDWTPPGMTVQELASVHQSLGDIFRNDPLREEASWYHFGLGTGSAQERLAALLKYGDSLFQHNRWIESKKAFESSLSLADNAEEQVEVRLKLIQPLFRGGQHAQALKILEESGSILKRERDNPKQWRWVQKTLREMGSIYIKEGRLELARESLQASRVLLEQHEDNPQEEMVLDNLKSSLLMREGKLTEASDLSEKMNKLWQSWPTEQKAQVLNSELATIYLAQGKFEKAKAQFEAQVRFFEETGHPERQTYALYGLALANFNLGNLEEAIRVYHTCAKVSRSTKNEELLFHVFNELGNIAYQKKDWPQSSEDYRHALDLAQHLADVNSCIGIAINLALVLQRQGDPSSAKLYLQHVIDTLETQPSLSLSQIQFFIQGYLTLGKLMVEDLKWTEARDSYRDALHLIRSHTALERFRFRTLMGLIQADISLKRTDEAQKFLAELSKFPLSSEEQQDIEKVRKQLQTPH